MAAAAIPTLMGAIKTVGAAATSKAGLAAMTVASGGLSAFGQLRSAQAQSDALKADAERLKLQAADDRIQRNETLLRAMAGRNAASGARGITAGTLTPAMNEDLRQTKLGQASADASFAGRESTLRARASNAQQAGKIAAGAGLFSTLSSLSRIGS
jgi:hypothetical protein